MKKKLFISGMIALLATFVITSCAPDVQDVNMVGYKKSAAKVKAVSAEKRTYTTGGTSPTAYTYAIVEWDAVKNTKKGPVGYSVVAQQEGKNTILVISNNSTNSEGYSFGPTNMWYFGTDGSTNDHATTNTKQYYQADPDKWAYRHSISSITTYAASTTGIPNENDYFYGKKVRFGVRTSSVDMGADYSDIVWGKEYIQF